MNEKKQKRERRLGQLLGTLCSLAMGMAGGLLVAKIIVGRSMGEMLAGIAVAVILLYAAMFLQTILHEAGHLLGGLWSGYDFSSFRIGRFMWIRENGKIRCKRLRLAGTGGQCLMIPPELVDGKIPFLLYNLGGSAVNLLTALICFGLSLLCGGLIRLFMQILAVVGLGYGLMNGVPLKLGTLNNDGRNALDLVRSPEAIRSFWVQTRLVEQTAKGIRVRDMPEAWFSLPDGAGMKNSMTAVVAVLCESRLMDTHAFSDAADLIDRLLNMDSGLVGIHRDMLRCDRLFCELVGNRDSQVINQLLGKDLDRAMKQMRTSPSVLRTQYAQALLWDRDPEKAARYRKDFEKYAKVYPYPSDIESERELLEIADQMK